MNEAQETALFALAVAMTGYWSEVGSIARYMSVQEYQKAIRVCKETNPARYEKELAPHFENWS